MFGKWSALPVSLFLSSQPPESRTTLLASRMIGRRGEKQEWGEVGANNLGVIKAAEGKRSVCTMSRGRREEGAGVKQTLTLPLKRMGLRKGEGLLIPLKM